MFTFSRRAALALPILALFAAGPLKAAADDADNTVVMSLKSGKVVIRLRPDWAPKHVEQIKTLVKRGFYDGIVFHRVIPGFMAQTGDPTGTGTGGSDLPNLSAEFNGTHFARGILGMARAQDPNSANSQFFIVTKDSGFLDGQYTAFGEVVSGMDAVDKIKAGAEANNGMVTNPDKILSMKMAGSSK
jgi:peptidylprolyl isomerase